MAQNEAEASPERADATPQGTNLPGAASQGASRQGATPQGADPQGATPQGADPQGAAPRDAHLQGAERRRASGIYGAIVTAAIFAATSGLSTTRLVIAVVVTLIVYWLAEEYAELLSQQIEQGRLPSLRRIGRALADTWPMVTASFLPLAAVVIARLAGASDLTAANVGLAVVVLLLAVHSWAAARAARLTGWRLAGATATAVGLGLAMVALKNLVLLNLH